MPHSVLGVQFIYIGIIAFIAYCTARFYVAVLTPKKSIKRPLEACTLLTFLLLAPISWMIFHIPWIGSFWMFIGYSIPAIALFSDRFSLRISAFFFALVTYISTELIPASLIMAGSMIFAHKTLYPRTLLLEGNMAFALFYVICSGIVLRFALNILTSAFHKQFQYFKTRTVIYLTLPFFFVMVLCNTLTICTNYKQYFLASILVAIVFPLCLYIVSKGLQSLQRQELMTLQAEKKAQQLEQRLDSYRLLNSSFFELRRWKHDTANHLTVVSFLLETKKYDEAIQYLDNFIENAPNKSQTNVL